jgi:hypothetical protein
MIVDYDGRIVAQATPGDGEKITVGPINLGALRCEREARLAHQMRLHLRSEAHAGYQKSCFPAGTFTGQKDRTYEDNADRIEETRRRLLGVSGVT